MTLYKIVSSGERVGKSLASGPALRANEIRPRSVTRRSDRRSTPILRRCWDAVDFGYIGFLVAYSATVAAALHVAIGRGL